MEGACPEFALTSLKASPPKLFTLVIPVQEAQVNGATQCQVLLGQKKRGFGAGLWNGFGGKVEPGEGIQQSALRELLEEACITAIHIAHVGVLTFIFDDNPQPWEVHVYRVESFQGSPTETEEMRPRWYDQHAIPYDTMWADDPHWYPLFLSQQRFKGIFVFKNSTQLCWHQVKVVQDFGDTVWWAGVAHTS